MQLNVVHTTSAAHIKSPFLVVIPSRVSATGRRIYRRFPTRPAAEHFARQITNALRLRGEASTRYASAADAMEAAAILKGTGITLAEAARRAVNAPCDTLTIPSSGGAGAEHRPPTTPLAPTQKRPTTATLRTAYEAMCSARAHQSPVTQENRASKLRTLCTRAPYLADTPLHKLTRATIRRALDAAWKSSPTAWNDGLKHLSAILTYAVRNDLTASNPARGIERRHVREKEITALTPADLRALFDACRPPTAAERRTAALRSTSTYLRRCLLQDTTGLSLYIALGAFAGVRPTECTRLRWRDYSPEDAVISVRKSASKTGGARHIELTPALAQWLDAHRPPGAGPDELIIPPADLRFKLAAVRLRAGYNAERPWQDDALRHSYASYYLKSGGSLDRLQLNMGHATTALIYSRYCNMAGLTRAMATEWWQITPAKGPS